MSNLVIFSLPSNLQGWKNSATIMLNFRKRFLQRPAVPINCRLAIDLQFSPELKSMSHWEKLLREQDASVQIFFLLVTSICFLIHLILYISHKTGQASVKFSIKANTPPLSHRCTKNAHSLYFFLECLWH